MGGIRRNFTFLISHLSLALFMLRILAADNATHHGALAAPTDDEAAVFADGLDGSADFHEKR